MLLLDNTSFHDPDHKDIFLKEMLRYAAEEGNLGFAITCLSQVQKQVGGVGDCGLCNGGGLLQNNEMEYACKHSYSHSSCKLPMRNTNI